MDTHTLFRGVPKMNGEMNFIVFCYNFLRTQKNLGFEGMMQAINDFKPDYRKIVCAINKRSRKKPLPPNEAPPIFTMGNGCVF